MTQVQKAAILFFAIPFVAVIITRIFTAGGEPEASGGYSAFANYEWAFWLGLVVVVLLVALGWYAYNKQTPKTR